MQDEPTEIDPAELLEMANQVASVSPSPAPLTDKARLFAAHLVLLGGNATKAAELAGYSSVATMGAKLRLDPRVQELVRKMSIVQLDLALPVAVAALISIAQDEKAPIGERRKAANDLLDRAGVRRTDPQQAPTVAVQVNVGDKQPASAVISSVWANRTARTSSIVAPMPDAAAPRLIDQRDDGAKG